MIRSMTGYGRKEVAFEGARLTIEVRSVNNRFIDVQVKIPRSLGALESRVKKAVQERCSRGRIDVFVSRSGDAETTGRIVVDERLLEQYVGVMKDIRQRYRMQGEVDLGTIASFPGLVTVAEEKEDLEKVWMALAEGLNGAVAELEAMRAEEGKTLVEDMLRRLDLIEQLMQSVQELSPQTVEQARTRMQEALARLLNEPPDPARLAQEMAILAERTDVTEEITRLGSHLRQYRALVSGTGGEPVGRKLDFLLQEMGREANTIASKALNARIAHHVVDIKAELEKIREQAQNIE